MVTVPTRFIAVPSRCFEGARLIEKPLAKESPRRIAEPGRSALRSAHRAVQSDVRSMSKLDVQPRLLKDSHQP
jgi:hypothetical protein